MTLPGLSLGKPVKAIERSLGVVILSVVSACRSVWKKAGKIWYIALRDRLRSKSNFARAASATVSVAKDLYGNGSKEMKAVQKAWKAVGVI